MLCYKKTGYPHTPTPIEVDNQCDVSILANTVRQRLSKSIYIRFFWARDRIRQDQFCVYWRPDKNDRADYFNKYHAPLRYKEMCSIYLVILLSNWTYYHKVTQMIYRLIDVIMCCSKGVLASTSLETYEDSNCLITTPLRTYKH